MRPTLDSTVPSHPATPLGQEGLNGAHSRGQTDPGSVLDTLSQPQPNQPAMGSFCPNLPFSAPQCPGHLFELKTPPLC